MPWSQHSCTYPGCGEPLPPGRKGRCDQHPYPDAHDHESQRLYSTWQWKKIRKAQLTKEPWCADCLRGGIYTAASEVDHIVPHRGDRVKFFTGPRQSLCRSCHSRKTNSELRGGLENVFTRGAQSGRGLQYEKKSPMEAGNE